jgi:hypothetical protein
VGILGKMKKIMLSLLVASFFVAAAGTASAQMMGGYWQNGGTAVQPAQNSEVNAALQDIYASQKVSSQDKIDCSKVTDDQFDKLGDAYMGVMLPNQQQHQTMDNMMGGEGSASLKQAHINMGRSYLGCWSNYSGAPSMMSMMGITGGYGMMGGYNNTGFGMMGRNFGNGWNMMGSYGGYGWFGWITMIMIWVLLVLGIIALVKWLGKK